MTFARALIETRSNPLENPDRPLTDSSLLDVLGIGLATDAGIAVTPETAMRFSAVYRAIALLSGLLGSLPLQTYEKDPSGRKRVDEQIIDQPSPDETPFDAWEAAGVGLFSGGNGYKLKLRDRLGRARELEPLYGKQMTRVERRPEWRTDKNPTGKRFFYQDGSTERVYTPYEVLHLRGMSLDGLTGLSPIGMNRQGIGTALAAERFGAQLFSRGALIQGVLQAKDELEDEQVERMQRQWAAKTAGGANHWKIPVLDAGAEFKSIQLPPADAQYIETRKMSVVDVARMYGLPPHLLADVERSTSWGKGIEEQNMAMLVFTFDPWLVRIEQRLTMELLPPNRYCRFNRAALLRTDLNSRSIAYQRGINNGWWCADDIRELEDQPPLPDGLGQIFYMPKNLVPVTKQLTSGATQ